MRLAYPPANERCLRGGLAMRFFFVSALLFEAACEIDSIPSPRRGQPLHRCRIGV